MGGRVFFGVCQGGCERERRIEVFLGGQGGCERRIEVFVKIKKKNRGGGGRVGKGVLKGPGFHGGRVGGQIGCERRIEVFVKIHKKKKKSGRGSGWM